MKNFTLGINSRVDILWNKGVYKSVVQDYQNQFMYINIPVANGEYLTLERGEEISGIYYDDKGNVYSLDAKVVDKVKEGALPLYKLTEPYNVKKIQRRNFVRVEFTHGIKYKSETMDKATFYNGILLDLSGGGMRMKIKEKLNSNDKVFVRLQYETEVIEVSGKIIRVQKAPDGEFICGVDFKEISEPERDRIIKTVFTVMRKQRGLQ